MSHNGNNFLITFTDYLSLSFHTVPISCDDIESFPATALADAYFTQIFSYHCLPSAVHTDRGSTFTLPTHTPCLSSQMLQASTISSNTSLRRHCAVTSPSTSSSGLAIPTRRTRAPTTPSSSRSPAARLPLKPGSG
eukprot:809023-Rhodomonas_salina.1